MAEEIHRFTISLKKKETSFRQKNLDCNGTTIQQHLLMSQAKLMKRNFWSNFEIFLLFCSEDFHSGS